MTSSAPVEPQGWTRRRWWGAAACVFGLQLGLIVWLGDRTPSLPRLPAPAPVLHLAGSRSAELALSDPTVFALPHPKGFSGLAWLTVPRRQFPPFDWPEAPEEPSLPVQQQLGATFNQFIQTNSFKSLTLPESEPELTLPGPIPLAPCREHSEFRLEGDLARRKLLTPPTLPSWPHPDLLTNTIVQIVVDTDGKRVSVPLLLSSSGHKAADQHALAAARSARFEPVSGGGPESGTNVLSRLTWGRMVFEWHTLPMSTTNATPATNP